MPENRQMKYCIQNFPIGNLQIEVAENCLTHIIYTDLPPTSNEISDEILSGTILQLNEYFAGTRKKFDLPLAPAGTDFQQKVWRGLLSVEYGNTFTYKELAELVNSPKACRAVGHACHLNPVSIVIPCHRIIGHNGTLTGYAGGLQNKQFLLDLEKRHKYYYSA